MNRDFFSPQLNTSSGGNLSIQSSQVAANQRIDLSVSGFAPTICVSRSGVLAKLDRDPRTLFPPDCIHLPRNCKWDFGESFLFDTGDSSVWRGRGPGGRKAIP